MGNIKIEDFKSLLNRLDCLEHENNLVIKHASIANQNIRLVGYQIREFIHEVDNYERLQREERDFYNLGAELDRMFKKDNSKTIVVNNIFSPTIENNNHNSNSNL